MADQVDFGSTKIMGLFGLIAGVVIAVGFPWIVMAYVDNTSLGGFATAFLVTIGILGGAGIAVIAAFFSIVIPARVRKYEES
jgi:hypothetical protein